MTLEQQFVGIIGSCTQDSEFLTSFVTIGMLEPDSDNICQEWDIVR